MPSGLVQARPYEWPTMIKVYSSFPSHCFSTTHQAVSTFFPSLLVAFLVLDALQSSFRLQLFTFFTLTTQATLFRSASRLYYLYSNHAFYHRSHFCSRPRCWRYCTVRHRIWLRWLRQLRLRLWQLRIWLWQLWLRLRWLRLWFRKLWIGYVQLIVYDDGDAVYLHVDGTIVDFCVDGSVFHPVQRCTSDEYRRLR
jgi:hypothetical protein